MPGIITGYEYDIFISYRQKDNKGDRWVSEFVEALKTEPDTLVKETLHLKETFNEQKKEGSKKEVITKGIINQNSKKRLIILLAVFLFIASANAIYKIINYSKQTQPLSKLEKSIAVLPFVNDSPDKENTYFINGIMEEILNNLQKIRDFRVLSRTSVKQFRGETKPTLPEIAKKLNVNYIVEGSGQKYGNKFVLRVQLIAANNEKHLWGKSYGQEIHETNDIINIQSQIAQSIAAELKATMTHEEKQLIEKTPTANLTAYDFYQRGREEHTRFWLDNRNKAALQKAEGLYHKSLKYDSTFAKAYTGLARVYWDKHYWEEYFSKNFLDSVMIYTDIALSFDNQLAEAYTLQGKYYNKTGKSDWALEEFDKSLKINPDSWEAYAEKGQIFRSDDIVKYLDNIQKAASLNHGLELQELLRDLSYWYLNAGFIDKAGYYNLEALKLDGDSALYLSGLSDIEDNPDKEIEFLRKGYGIDSSNADIVYGLAFSYMGLKQYNESLKYYKKYVGILNSTGTLQIIQCTELDMLTG